MCCRNCDSERLLSFSGKCNDLFNATLNGKEHEGEVPHGLGIGGGDYITMVVCLDCGMSQGHFPVLTGVTEKYFRYDSEEEEFPDAEKSNWE